MSNEYIKGRVKCFKIDVFFLREIAEKEESKKETRGEGSIDGC